MGVFDIPFVDLPLWNRVPEGKFKTGAEAIGGIGSMFFGPGLVARGLGLGAKAGAGLAGRSFALSRTGTPAGAAAAKAAGTGGFYRPGSMSARWYGKQPGVLTTPQNIALTAGALHPQVPATMAMLPKTGPWAGLSRHLGAQMSRLGLGTKGKFLTGAGIGLGITNWPEGSESASEGLTGDAMPQLDPFAAWMQQQGMGAGGGFGMGSGGTGPMDAPAPFYGMTEEWMQDPILRKRISDQIDMMKAPYRTAIRERRRGLRQEMQDLRSLEAEHQAASKELRKGMAAESKKFRKDVAAGRKAEERDISESMASLSNLLIQTPEVRREVVDEEGDQLRRSRERERLETELVSGGAESTNEALNAMAASSQMQNDLDLKRANRAARRDISELQGELAGVDQQYPALLREAARAEHEEDRQYWLDRLEAAKAQSTMSNQFLQYAGGAGAGGLGGLDPSDLINLYDKLNKPSGIEKTVVGADEQEYTIPVERWTPDQKAYIMHTLLSNPQALPSLYQQPFMIPKSAIEELMIEHANDPDSAIQKAIGLGLDPQQLFGG